MELFDIMATTLEQAGIEAQHTHFAHSYTAQLQGDPGDSQRAAFTEGGYARHEPHCFEGLPTRDHFARNKSNIYYPKSAQQQDYPDSVGRVVAMRTATHRFVFRPPGVCELYDMQADPQELHNRYGGPVYREVQQKLETEMLRWLVQTGDVTPFDNDPRGLTGLAL